MAGKIISLHSESLQKQRFRTERGGSLFGLWSWKRVLLRAQQLTA